MHVHLVLHLLKYTRPHAPKHTLNTVMGKVFRAQYSRKLLRWRISVLLSAAE
jgi:hypothetical protein